MLDLIVYTIGHSTHTPNRFVGLLKKNLIEVVIDVRSIPYSRHNPQYNRENLDEELKENQIEYVFLGNELGARVNDRSCFRNGQVQYHLLAQRQEFKEAIEMVKQRAKNKRTTLMCSEKEPFDCHRTILIAQELIKSNVSVIHILWNGIKESHNETLDRLVEKLYGQNGNLFMNSNELREDALVKQANRIAYKLTDDES